MRASVPDDRRLESAFEIRRSEQPSKSWPLVRSNGYEERGCHDLSSSEPKMNPGSLWSGPINDVHSLILYCA